MPNDALVTKADLVRRLHCAEGHLHGVRLMVEGEAECESILRQLLAVRAALREVNRLLIRRHLDTCLRGLLQVAANDAASREKYLDEIVALYQLLGASAPLKGKELD
jgi:DNA-binding FrmR family transcriptional regulator